MKLYSKISSLLLFAIISLSACDDWDFDTDSSYEGLFRTPKIEAKDLDATYIDLLWSKVPNSDYYKMELSEDSLKFETNLQEVNNGEAITKNEYTIENLLGSTRYSIRIKAYSNTGIKESEWATYTFKTKSEQILNEVSEITSSSAVLTWDSKLDVDSYIIYEGGGTTGGKKVSLTDTEKQEGKLTLTDLKEATTYRVVIKLGDLTRGTRTFTTTENFPEGYKIVYLGANDDFKTVLSAQEGKVVIVLPLESDIVLDASMTIPSSITSVIFWGATGGTEKAKLLPKAFVAEVGSSMELIKFYNLTLYNAGMGADYVINQNVAANINTISIENCEVKETRGVIRIQGSGNNSVIDKIEYTNTIFTKVGDYGLVNATVSTITLKEIYVNKSTINTQNGRTFDLNNIQNSKVYINQCTFYNAISNEFIRVKAGQGTEARVSNSIFGKIYTGASKIKASNPAGYTFGEQVSYTSDCVWDGTNSIGNEHSKTSDELFEDPENGIFRIKDPSFTLQIGDPRWLE